MRIKRADGAVVEVDRDFLLDGETMVIPLTMMDSMRHLIHDGSGGPVGQRPGFLVRDNAAEDQAVETAYEEYAKNLSDRWRGPSNPPPPASKTFASREAALEDAYATYDAAISERWRTGPGQRPPKQTEPPQTFENAEAARIGAYAEYNRSISERWRKSPTMQACRQASWRRSRARR